VQRIQLRVKKSLVAGEKACKRDVQNIAHQVWSCISRGEDTIDTGYVIAVNLSWKYL
jgi:hypothetical protein